MSLARTRSFASPARTHERNETISRSEDSVPLRSHHPTSDINITQCRSSTSQLRFPRLQRGQSEIDPQSALEGRDGIVAPNTPPLTAGFPRKAVDT